MLESNITCSHPFGNAMCANRELLPLLPKEVNPDLGHMEKQFRVVFHMQESSLKTPVYLQNASIFCIQL